MAYLFSGYMAIWIVIFGYTLLIRSRQKRLEEEISLLRREIERRGALR